MAVQPPSTAAAGLLIQGAGLAVSSFTYSIPTAGSQWVYGNETKAAGYGVLNASQAAAFISAIKLWDRLIAPNFTQTNDVSAPGAVRVAFTDYAAISAAFAYTYVPTSTGAIDGDIWINAIAKSDSFDVGSWDYQALIHEIGHALGLQHTFEAAGFPSEWDSAVYSVMSYEHTGFVYWSYESAGAGGVSLTDTGVSAQGPMVLDIAAVQQRYGADKTTAAGDDVYAFGDDQPFILAIYDAGGNDTIDASSAKRGSVIDLTPGAYSSIGQFSIADQIAYAQSHFGDLAAKVLAARLAQGDAYTFTDNMGIAYSTVIENAIGGAGSDRITGNDAANRLEGRGGDDLIDGGAGGDIAVFGVSSAAASWSHNVDGSWTVSAGALGTDTLINIETLRFTDRDVALTDVASDGGHAHRTENRDFTGDGTADILLSNAKGEVAIWTAGPRGALVEKALGVAGPAWTVQDAADFSGDGKADLLWRNAAGDVVLWNSTADGFSGQLLGSVGKEWSIEDTADFNSDGKADILWRDIAGNVVIWNSTADGFAGQFAGAVGREWDIQQAADFNGDGAADILWRNTAGDVVIWNSSPTGFVGQFAGLVANSWTIETAADFTGDGRADILWRDTTGQLVVWASGDKGFAGYFAGSIDTKFAIAQAADFNGDGKADLVGKSAGGELMLWMASDSGNAFSASPLTDLPGEWQLF